MEEKRGITERKMWRFSSDIKSWQAIWKRSRDEIKPTDDWGTMQRGMIVGWVDMEISGVGQRGRALSWLSHT